MGRIGELMATGGGGRCPKGKPRFIEFSGCMKELRKEIVIVCNEDGGWR